MHHHVIMYLLKSIHSIQHKTDLLLALSDGHIYVCPLQVFCICTITMGEEHKQILTLLIHRKLMKCMIQVHHREATRSSEPVPLVLWSGHGELCGSDSLLHVP